jgi:hypothetical protein
LNVLNSFDASTDIYNVEVDETSTVVIGSGFSNDFFESEFRLHVRLVGQGEGAPVDGERLPRSEIN